MTTNVAYHSTSNIFVRFRDHATLGLADDLGTNVPQNLIEKVGNCLVSASWVPYNGIKSLVRKLEDPRVVTIGLTAIALLANSYLFYPTATHVVVTTGFTAAMTLVQNLDVLGKIRPVAYALTCIGIAGYGTRAEGRFTNSELMQNFYGVKGVSGNPAGMSYEQIIAIKAKAE